MNSKKNIILFIPSLGRGGAERVFVNLSNVWIKKYNVTLIHQYDDNFLAEFLDKNIKQLKISRNFLLACFQFYKIVRKEKPLFVLSCLNIPNIINGFVSKLFFMKHKVVLRQAAPLNRVKINRIISFLLSNSFSLSDLVICNSETTQDTLNNKKYTAVISNPVITSGMERLSNNLVDLDNRLLDRKYILSVGRLETVKNFKLLIESYIKLGNIDYALVILGEGSQRDDLEKLITINKLNDKVYLMGAVQNPYVYYKNASLFVSTSLHEGFGNVYIEAAYFSLPIVATKSGAAQEILNYGEFGYIVERYDTQSIANIIQYVISQDQLKRIPKKKLEHYQDSHISDLYLEEIFNKNKKKAFNVES